MPQEDKRAPMASAPMAYKDDGSVDWGNMWDTFCLLAQEGGPPHRATLLEPSPAPNPADPQYAVVVAEIVRGVLETSGLEASADEPGWIAVRCHSSAMAVWLADAIVQENVAAQTRGDVLLIPTGEQFQLKGEIKNVVTAVAKTTHYWYDHISGEAKALYILEDKLARWKTRLGAWLPFRSNGETS